MTDKNKPAHTIRRPGGLKLTIWKNDGQNGPFYTTNLSRSYQDKSGQWQETTSFHQDDLLYLSKMTDEAETWIANEQAKAKAARPTQEAPEGGYAEAETERKRAGGRQP
jgi:hypothetical protein